MSENVVVTELNIYPVKSCQRVSLPSVYLDKYGFQHDRRFMLITGNGRFLSQRRYPVLATVKAMIETENTSTHQICKQLRMSSPHVSWDLELEPQLTGNTMEVGIWEDKAQAIDQGERAAEWIKHLLKTDATYNRLVAVGQSGTMRQVQIPKGFPTVSGRQLPFSDEGPILLISEESLADLNKRMKARTGNEVSMDHFRPNIVVSGCVDAFEEDTWLLVQIGSIPFMAYKNAERCKMTGINQLTGEIDKHGPLEVLREYRAPRGPGHAEFGQLLIPLETSGQITVGDKVTILDHKKRV